jgi:hypothetical protein
VKQERRNIPVEDDGLFQDVFVVESMDDALEAREGKLHTKHRILNE